MTLTSVQAIEAMVAPVVLITAGGIISNGVMSVSASVNDRMRTMNRERLRILTDEHGGLATVDSLAAAHRERVRQIDAQMPMLSRRPTIRRRPTGTAKPVSSARTSDPENRNRGPDPSMIRRSCTTRSTKREVW